MSFSKRDTLVVKGAAILMLLFYHLFYYEPMFIDYDVNFAPFAIREVMGVSKVGNICVSIFLFLTVFGIYRGYEALEKCNQQPISPKGFLWLSLKRYFSLMFGFLAVYVTTLLFFFWELSLQDIYGVGFRGIYNFVLDITGLSQFFNTATLNSSWWYLELAVIIIFLMPFLYKSYEKWGNYLIPVILLLPFILDVNYMTEKYRLTVLLAMLCAKSHLLENAKEKVLLGNKQLSQLIKLVVLLAGMGFAIYIRQYEGDLVAEEVKFLAEGLLAFLLIAFLYLFITQIPGISRALAFLGKYSMSMYFAHLFFSYSFVKIRGLVFSCRYFILIYVVLVLVVLTYAILLEQLKKVTRWDKLLQHIRGICDKNVEDSFQE